MNRNTILPVVSHEYETWSLTLKEEHRLGMFEYRVLGQIFGPNKNRELEKTAQ